MGLEVGGIDHHGLLFTVLGSQTGHHRGEDTLVAPSLPTIVKRLVRPIGSRCVTPLYAIAVNENNAARHTPVIDAWLPWDFGKKGSSRFDIAIQLETRPKMSERSPDFDVTAVSKSGRKVRIGTAWNETGNTTGNPYISMQLDVGLGPFRFNAVQSKEAVRRRAISSRSSRSSPPAP